MIPSIKNLYGCFVVNIKTVHITFYYQIFHLIVRIKEHNLTILKKLISPIISH